jgi:bacillithiol biosynthesis cysteine-adding enzyme BshC
MELHAEPSRFKIYKGLAGEYVDHFDSVKTFYPRNFRIMSSYEARLKELDGKTFQRQRLADVLESFNKALGCSDTTLKNISRFRQDDAVVVITGQQAGIFTGALYTVYKAITTLKLAASMETALGRPVVPVFWIASEDHDFQEIRVAHYLAGGNLKRVQIDRADKRQTQRRNLKKTSVGHMETNDSAKASIEQILSDFSGTEDLENFEALFKTTFIEKESLSNWFGRIMNHLFQDYGLVLIDPMLEGVRMLEIEFFKTAIHHQEDIIKALESRRIQVAEHGFRPSLEFDPKGTQLFIYEEGERLPLRFEDGQFRCNSDQKSYEVSRETLFERMEETPWAFSTNVVLRPIVQDHLFPTLAYVAGPGEINYYGQLGEVYPIFGMQMPILYPRENFTLVQKEVTNLLDQYQLSPEDVLMCGISSIRDHLLDLRDEVRIDALFDAYMEKFDREYGELIDRVLEISPDLKALSEKNMGLIKAQMDYLKEKAHRFHRRNHKQIAKDLSSVEHHLMPGGKVQERTLSILQYYADKGSSLIDFLVQEVPLDPGHRIIRLG